MESNEKIDYDVVSEFAGHQSNTGVKIVDAISDIFSKVKEKSMQLAVKGEFMSFNSVDELDKILRTAAKEKYSIRCYDEIIGG